MIGAKAARHLNQELSGYSIHRRGLRVNNIFVDGHFRLSAGAINAHQLDPIYMQNLGIELANLDIPVLGEFLSQVEAGADAVPDAGFGTCPLLMTPGTTPDAFDKMRKTVLYSLLRNMMCKLTFYHYYLL